ncbi:hypothetical protein HDU96_002222, partial [Phlyctochytrium bullatum]
MRATTLFAVVVSAFCAVVTASPIRLERRAAVTTTPNPNVPSSGNVVLKDYTWDDATSVISGNIWIRNIAYTKLVKAIYSSPAGVWTASNVINAAYSGPSINGFELWAFTATAPANLGSGSQFYLRYDVSGQ